MSFLSRGPILQNQRSSLGPCAPSEEGVRRPAVRTCVHRRRLSSQRSVRYSAAGCVLAWCFSHFHAESGLAAWPVLQLWAALIIVLHAWLSTCETRLLGPRRVPCGILVPSRHGPMPLSGGAWSPPNRGVPRDLRGVGA